MIDADKILPLLIHDLRTPIGVAQGYVRLLQEQRLASPEERERALTRTMDALGRLSKLCAEASSFFSDGSGAPSIALDVSSLVSRVEARMRARQLPVTGEIDPAARLRIAGDPDRLAEAIEVVLGAVRSPAGKLAESVLTETRMAELRLMAAPTGTPPSPGDHGRVPFDPWHGHGLGVALACYVINASQGGVWTTGSGVLIAFPLEEVA